MRDIFVVTNHKKYYYLVLREAQQAWDFEIKHKLVHWVNDASDLICAPARVMLCGKYFMRPDWPLIERVIRQQGHVTLLVR